MNAICLGLGGEPKHLGRADDARAFIQNGKDEAMIEIELEPLADARVPHIFRRDIDRNKGSERGRGKGASTFFMNGQKVKPDALNEVIKSKYNIDLSNLCTFLPQDRVGNFSGMTPQDLLIETQKTLSKSQHLYNVHQELIEAEEELNSNSSESGNVDVLEKALAATTRELQDLERAKDLFEKRAQALQKMDLFRAKHIWMEVDDCLLEAQELRDRKKELKAQLKDAQRELEPKNTRLSELEEMKREVDHEEKRMTKDKANIVKDIEKQGKKFETHEDEIEELAAKVLDLENRGDQNQKAIRDAESKVTQYTSQIAGLGVDMELLQSEYDTTKKASYELKIVKQQAENELRVVKKELREFEDHASEIQRKLVKQQDSKRKQLDAVFTNKKFHGAREICDIIQRNLKKFRHQVHGPVATLVTPKPGTEKQHAAFLEHHVSDQLWRSYVVGSKQDQDTLYQLVREELNRPINIIAVDRIEDEVRRPYSDARMKQLRNNYGLEGYLDQRFDAPPIVMQALRTQSSIHTVFVGGSKTQDAIDKSGLLTTLMERENGGSKQNFVLCCPNRHNQLLLYNTRVSEYSGKESVRIDQVKNAEFLLTSNPESDRVAQRLQSDLEAVHDNIRESRKKSEDTEKRKNAVEIESQEAAAEHQQIRDRFKDMKSLQSRLDASKEKLKRAVKENEDHEQNAHKEKRELRLKLQNRVTHVIAALAAGEKGNKALLKVRSQIVKLKVKNSKITSEHQKASDDLEEAKKEFADLEKSALDTADRFKKAKETLSRLKDEANEKYPLDDEDGNPLPLKAQLTAINVDTIDDLEALIEDCQREADAIIENPEAIRKYKDKVREKRDLEDKLEDAKNFRDTKVHHIESTLAPWEAQLTNLMAKVDEKFSQYMAEMGFTGSVELSKGAPDEKGNPRNFKDWGITIKVSFRDGVKAQVLSARVQSGGERSVSTIMFLMALQDMMVAPFRCVDEINQGLDENNERGVFKRIVANSCQPPKASATDHEGQYFLVTPKLLPNLYDMEEEAMTVLFVFNGFHDLHQWQAAQIAAASNDEEDGDESRPSKKRKST